MAKFAIFESIPLFLAFPYWQIFDSLPLKVVERNYWKQFYTYQMWSVSSAAIAGERFIHFFGWNMRNLDPQPGLPVPQITQILDAVHHVNQKNRCAIRGIGVLTGRGGDAMINAFFVHELHEKTLTPR